MTEETTEAPVETATAEPVATPDLIERTAAESAAAPEADAGGQQEAPPVEERRTVFPKEAIDQLTVLRARERQTKAELEQERAQRMAAQQMLSRLAAQNPQQQSVQQHQPQPTPADIQRYAQYQVFLAKVEEMRNEGLRRFGADFNSAIQTLNAVGADADDVVDAVMHVAGNRAHEVLHDLAQDPARAAAIVGLNPTQRIVELVKMSNKAPSSAAGKSSALSVSKAPAPAPKVQATTSSEKPRGWAATDKMSDKEFNAWFDNRQKERADTRRNGGVRH